MSTILSWKKGIAPTKEDSVRTALSDSQPGIAARDQRDWDGIGGRMPAAGKYTYSQERPRFGDPSTEQHNRSGHTTPGSPGSDKAVVCVAVRRHQCTGAVNASHI